MFNRTETQRNALWTQLNITAVTLYSTSIATIVTVIVVLWYVEIPLILKVILTIADSILLGVSSFSVFQITHTWRKDLIRQRALEALTPEEVKSLIEEYENEK